MRKKLVKHGSSLALIIDKPILDLQKIDADARRLIHAPAAPSERRQKFEAAQQLTHHRFARAFQKLAE